MRLAFLQLLADWMLKLRERIDHQGRLLPYALSALSDDSRAVQMSALTLLDDLGAQYEEEHEHDLKVTLVARVHSKGPELWQIILPGSFVYC